MPPIGAMGDAIYRLIERLYPICRSITGRGVRETLGLIREVIPIEIREVPSGTGVLDWTVPNEWNIREAWIRDVDGRAVVDFRDSNLHVMSYSVPIRGRMSLADLRPHLHAIPEQPDRIPYRTSYYREDWGFCLSHDRLSGMTDPEYDVLIDSTLEPGHLTYAELLVHGASDREFLVSAHVCHPSLCNDNLSGVAIAVYLARRLLDGPRPHHSYRFLFIPGTIGAITWLALHREDLGRIRGGLTLVCLGDSSPLTYKRTFAGDTPIDLAAAHVLGGLAEGAGIIDYFPYGYDERQYNSPGFRLPVGSLMRGRHGEFPEYHTSGDDLGFVHRDRLAASFEALAAIVEAFEADRTYINCCPHGEPQLGRRGVYGEMDRSDKDAQLALLWVLSLADGTRSLLEMADRSGLALGPIRDAAGALLRCGLLREEEDRVSP